MSTRRLPVEKRIFKALSTVTGRPRKHSLETIAGMYGGGLSAAEIGRRLCVDHTTVLYALRQMKVEIRPRPKQRRGKKAPAGWVNFSDYREAWRAERGIGPVEKLMQLAAPRKSRFAA